LKNGTSILPYTNSEEDGDGHEAPTTKEMDVNIRSADNDESAGSAYQRLLSAEENRTPLAFRFSLMNGQVLIVQNVVQHATREFNENGKFNALDVYGVGTADSEAALWSITNSPVTDVGLLVCFGEVFIGSGLTRYTQFDCPISTVDVDTFKFFPAAGTLKKLVVAGGNGNPTTFDVAIMKNSSATALAVSGVTTPGGDGWGAPVSDLTDTVSFNGTTDYMCIRVVNSGGNYLLYISVYAEFIPS
jgi:hypothetical protein